MLNAVIYTPDKVLFEGRAERIEFPGEQGVFEVQAYHKPLVSRLVGGNIVVDGEKLFPIRCGIVGIGMNKATVVVEE